MDLYKFLCCVCCVLCVLQIGVELYVMLDAHLIWYSYIAPFICVFFQLITTIFLIRITKQIL
jgi:hypothetical protein